MKQGKALCILIALVLALGIAAGPVAAGGGRTIQVGFFNGSVTLSGGTLTIGDNIATGTSPVTGTLTASSISGITDGTYSVTGTGLTFSAEGVPGSPFTQSFVGTITVNDSSVFLEGMLAPGFHTDADGDTHTVTSGSLSLTSGVGTLSIATSITYGETTVTWNVSGTVKTSSIQAAINAAAPGDTINVAAGTYQEQVVINKSLTLQGASKDTTTIQAPDTMTATSWTHRGAAFKAVIEVNGASAHGISVGITGFTIDGMNKASASPRYTGIVYHNADGTVSNNTITKFGSTPPDANGWGVFVVEGSNVTISSNTIDKWGKGGVVVDGDDDIANTDVTSTVSGNTITGAGDIAAVAQNGVQISRGATGTVTGNTISGNFYSGTDWSGSGILLYASKNVQVTGNTLNQNETGIYVNGQDCTFTTDGTTISGNNQINGSKIGIATYHAKNTTISGNTISGSTELGLRIRADSANTTIENNTIQNSGNAGIKIYNDKAGSDTCSGAPTGTVIRLNTITGNNTANDAGSGGVFIGSGVDGAAVAINFNKISSNNQHGILSASTTNVVDATNNWWGSLAGPAAGTISGNVTYSPWCGNAACTSNSCVTEGATDTLSDGGTLNLPSGGLSASLSGGSANVTLARYSANPGSDAGTLIGTDNNFYDVQVSGLSDPDATLTVQVAATAGQVLRYWDGAAWSTVRGNDGKIPVANETGVLTVVFGPTSRPKLAELTGTPIVSTDPEVLAVQFAGATSEEPVVLATAGQAITAAVVAKSTNLYGVQIDLDFDAAKLEVASVTLGGDLLAQHVAKKIYDNTAGTISFAFTQEGATRPQAGDNILLATITFVPKAVADTTAVTLTAATFADPDGMALGVYPGTLVYDDNLASLQIQGAASLEGTVTLQGRTDHSEVLVSLLQGTAVVRQTNTPDNGGFYWMDITPGAGYSAEASFAGYLRAKTDPFELGSATKTLPAVKLLGGDATRDQKINILDVSFIAIRFGGTDALADINGDGKVNILDLVLAGANFGKAGPQPWASS